MVESSRLPTSLEPRAGSGAAPAPSPHCIAGVTVAAAVAVAAVELAIHLDAAGTILDARVWSSAPDAPDNSEAAFWYVLAGLMMLPTAAGIHRLEAAGSPALRPAGVAIALLGLAGGVAKPASPF